MSLNADLTLVIYCYNIIEVAAHSSIPFPLSSLYPVEKIKKCLPLN